MLAEVGWQNPSSYYQMSSKGLFFNIPDGYCVTQTRINPYSMRNHNEYIEIFVVRAYEYLRTPYVWT